MLLIFYNTNTMIVNPIIYLRFLIPYLLYLTLLHNDIINFHTVLHSIFIMVALLLLYNVTYIINDYYDYEKDLLIGRRKRSFVYIISAEFKSIFIIHFLEIASLLMICMALYDHTVADMLLILYLVLIILSIIHSKIYPAKCFTFLVLRYIRVFSLPFFLCLLDYPFSKEFLIETLIIFPLWNYGSYLDYLRTKNLIGNINGIIRFLSLLFLISPLLLALYEVLLFHLNIYTLITLTILTIALAFSLNIIKRYNPLRGSKIIRRLLSSFGYPEQVIDEKVDLILEYFIYFLVLVGIFFAEVTCYANSTRL